MLQASLMNKQDWTLTVMGQQQLTPWRQTMESRGSLPGWQPSLHGSNTAVVAGSWTTELIFWNYKVFKVLIKYTTGSITSTRF